MPRASFLFAVAFLATATSASAQMRYWIGNNGKKLQAEFVALDGETLTLKTADGRRMDVELGKLTNLCQQYARKLADNKAAKPDNNDEIPEPGFGIDGPPPDDLPPAITPEQALPSQTVANILEKAAKMGAHIEKLPTAYNVHFPHTMQVNLIKAQDILDALKRAKEIEGLRLDGGFTQLDFTELQQIRSLRLNPASAVRSLRPGQHPPAITLQAFNNVLSMPRLSHLDLTNCGITDGAAAALTRLPRLRSLKLSKNKITDAGLPAIIALEHLAELELGRNQITDKGLETISKGLPNLQKLELYGTAITDIGLTALSNFKQLNTLGLAITRITANGLGTLNELSSLRELDIQGCKLHKEDLDRLSGLTGLKRLRLQFTGITSEDIVELKQSLRGCSFEMGASLSKGIGVNEP